MSLIVSIYVPTGIVLSGDSRTTGTRSQNVPNPQNPQASMTVQTQLVLSDSAEKIFLLYDRFGVGTFGEALINNMPVAHYVEQLQLQNTNNPPTSTQNLAAQLLYYFRNLTPIPRAGFIVIGYDANMPWVIHVDVYNNTTFRANITATGSLDYGIACGGETDIVNRLQSYPQFVPPFQVMNLQDAIDYSRHLIRSTIDQMRFEPRFATVGGAIDTLVATNKVASFLARKSLVCS